MNAQPVEPLIAVDIGNTKLHFGRFDEPVSTGLPRPRDAFSTPTAEPDLATLDRWLDDGPVRMCAVSVHREAFGRLRRWLTECRPAASIDALTCQQMPIHVAVAQPERVGMDRLAAAVAANRLRDPQRPAIVIDTGSAITVDLIDPQGTFRGGAILPGMQMSAAALHRATDALPLVHFDPAHPPAAVGTSTDAAIRSGLYWGTVGSLRETIARIAAELSGDAELFGAGGDIDQFGPSLGLPIRHVPELVLAGVALAAYNR